MIYAMFAMLILTFTVAAHLFKLRIRAVRSGEVKLSTFRLNNDENIPTKMQQASKNYSNLFEMPVFFYTAGALVLSLGLQTMSIIVLSWLFVLTRVVHSWLHLTSNHVIHRMQAFMAGNVCIILIWIILIWKYSVLQAA